MPLNKTQLLRGPTLRREFEAFTLAPPEANVVPIRDLMLVDTHSAGTGISTCIYIGNAANGDAGIRNGVLGEGTKLLEHPL